MRAGDNADNLADNTYSEADSPINDWTLTFDYHRTVIGYHGTQRSTAGDLVNGFPFRWSENPGDWLGHGIYFWEYAPRMAWDWAKKRYGEEAAVVGAMIRLGRCLDLLDPLNGDILDRAYHSVSREVGELPRNANKDKYLDCTIFNLVYETLADSDSPIDTCRAVFVPSGSMNRYWERSGVYKGSHIQICVRNSANILAVWHIQEDGSYGIREQE